MFDNWIKRGKKYFIKIATVRVECTSGFANVQVSREHDTLSHYMTCLLFDSVQRGIAHVSMRALAVEIDQTDFRLFAVTRAERIYSVCTVRLLV